MSSHPLTLVSHLVKVAHTSTTSPKSVSYAMSDVPIAPDRLHAPHLVKDIT